MSNDYPKRAQIKQKSHLLQNYFWVLVTSPSLWFKKTSSWLQRRAMVDNCIKADISKQHAQYVSGHLINKERVIEQLDATIRQQQRLLIKKQKELEVTNAQLEVEKSPHPIPQQEVVDPAKEAMWKMVSDATIQHLEVHIRAINRQILEVEEQLAQLNTERQYQNNSKTFLFNLLKKVDTNGFSNFFSNTEDPVLEYEQTVILDDAVLPCGPGSYGGSLLKVTDFAGGSDDTISSSDGLRSPSDKENPEQVKLVQDKGKDYQSSSPRKS